MAKKASGSNLLVDPEKKKEFIAARDHWVGLDDRANTAVGKRRQYEGEIKKLGFSMRQVKDSVWLATSEGEAEFKAEIASRLLAAAYSDADIGDQLALFLDHNRTPAVDRAYKEGQTAAMKNESATPAYAPETEQHRAFMEGYHDEQGRQVKAGIGKLDAKNGKKAGKSPVKGKNAPAVPKGKRGRPKKAAEPDLLEAAGKPAGTTLIKKADKDAKAAARAPKADAGPPRKPSAQPVTRASLAASKAAAKDEAESYFTRAKTEGNA